MTRNDLLLLCNDFSLDLENSSTIEVFLQEVLVALSRRKDPLFLKALLSTLASGTSTYAYPAPDIINVFNLFTGNLQLTTTTEDSLEAHSATWRTESTAVRAFTEDFLSRQFTLYPTPDYTSGAFIPVNGEPLGEDYPTGWLVGIYSYIPETDIPEFYGILIIMLTLAKEFNYPSQHQDIELAQFCLGVGKFLLGLLNHDINY